MKIYISCDIEGIAGIANWSETDDGGYDYSYFREIMTNEVKACCEALLKCGIKDITVKDAHDSARNILFDKLPKEVKIIREWSNTICDMLDGLDSTYDGIIYIGYHSPCGSDGNPLSHTLTTSHTWIKLNDGFLSEYQLNTYYAQSLNIPVIMVTGDEELTNIVKTNNKNTITVATKKGLHGAVISKHPDLVTSEIYNATIQAIQLLKTSKKNDLFIPTPQEYELQICYRNHSNAYRATFYPNAYYVLPHVTAYKSTNIIDVLKFIMFCDR